MSKRKPPPPELYPGSDTEDDIRARDLPTVEKTVRFDGDEPAHRLQHQFSPTRPGVKCVPLEESVRANLHTPVSQIRPELTEFIKGVRTTLQSDNRLKAAVFRGPENVRARDTQSRLFYCSVNNDQTIFYEFLQNSGHQHRLSANSKEFTHNGFDTFDKNALTCYNLEQWASRLIQEHAHERCEDLSFPQNSDPRTYIVFDSFFRLSFIDPRQFPERHKKRLEDAFVTILRARLNLFKSFSTFAHVIYIFPIFVGKHQYFWEAQSLALERTRNEFLNANVTILEILSVASLRKAIGDDFSKPYPYGGGASSLTKAPFAASHIPVTLYRNLSQNLDAVNVRHSWEIKARFVTSTDFPYTCPQQIFEGKRPFFDVEETREIEGNVLAIDVKLIRRGHEAIEEYKKSLAAKDKDTDSEQKKDFHFLADFFDKRDTPADPEQARLSPQSAPCESLDQHPQTNSSASQKSLHQIVCDAKERSAPPEDSAGASRSLAEGQAKEKSWAAVVEAPAQTVPGASSDPPLRDADHDRDLDHDISKAFHDAFAGPVAARDGAPPARLIDEPMDIGNEVKVPKLRPRK